MKEPPKRKYLPVLWKGALLLVLLAALIGVLQPVPPDRPSRVEAWANPRIASGAGLSFWGSNRLNDLLFHSRGPGFQNWVKRFARAYDYDTSAPPGGMTDQEMHLLLAFPEMQRLNLSRADISDEGLAKIRPLRNLEMLSVWGTGVTDAGLTNISNFTRLEELFLQDTQIQGPGLAALKNLRKLRVLRLDGLPLRDEHLMHLSGLENLERLDLGETQVSGEGLLHLAGLKKMKTLSFRSNKHLGHEGLRHLLPLYSQPGSGTKTNSLILGWTRIDDRALETLKQFRGLTTLNLKSTRISPAGLEELKRELSGVAIEHY